jgi:nucleotide-binding universal stress UspA family protein
LRAIAHPTDFSAASTTAFAHALRIALTAKCPLYILHVSTDAEVDDWATFPRVRQTLAQWGLMDAHESPAAIAEKLGVKVIKAEMMPMGTVHGILHFLHDHPADLIVLATEGREGLTRLRHPSEAEALARAAKIATLFVPAQARHFVDPIGGKLHLHRVLIPVDQAPAPDGAVRAILDFAQALAGDAAEARLLHVGDEAPQLAQPDGRALPVTPSQGDVVEAIVKAANDWRADLIGMPTAGHHGFLDGLRGSTTERVLRQAPCPVLTVPVR